MRLRELKFWKFEIFLKGLVPKWSASSAEYWSWRLIKTVFIGVLENVIIPKSTTKGRNSNGNAGANWKHSDIALK